MAPDDVSDDDPFDCDDPDDESTDVVDEAPVWGRVDGDFAPLWGPVDVDESVEVELVDDDSDPDSPEVSARATPFPATTAAPMPRATASPPIRAAFVPTPMGAERTVAANVREQIA